MALIKALLSHLVFQRSFSRAAIEWKSTRPLPRAPLKYRFHHEDNDQLSHPLPACCTKRETAEMAAPARTSGVIASQTPLCPPSAAGASALAELLSVAEMVARPVPARGCPWVERQTVASIVTSLRGEADEVCEELNLIAAESEAAAVGEGAMHQREEACGAAKTFSRTKELQSEIGDVLFNALLMVLVAERDMGVSVAGCFSDIRDKIIRRCPHVFGDEVAATPGEASALWKAAKDRE